LLYELEKKEYMSLSKIDKLITNEPKEGEFLTAQASEYKSSDAEQQNSYRERGTL